MPAREQDHAARLADRKGGARVLPEVRASSTATAVGPMLGDQVAHALRGSGPAGAPSGVPGLVSITPPSSAASVRPREITTP